MKFEEQFPSWKGFDWGKLSIYQRELVKGNLQQHCLDKQKAKDAFNNIPLFTDRIKIVEEFEKWAKNNKVEICLFSLVTWYDGKIRKYIKKELGL